MPRRPFQELLQLFAIERFVYRLSQSPQAGTFVLKGALMFAVWGGPVSRPTRDIDLLGEISNDVDMVAAGFRGICEVSVQPDGLSFDADSVTAVKITRDAEYAGVRVRLKGSLGKAPVSIQVDVGIGDVVTPAPQQVEYPTIFDFPAPHIRQRATAVSPAASLFTAAFATDSDKQIQWAAFVEKAALSDAPDSFVDVMAGVVLFVGPVVEALSGRKQFDEAWVAPGPWAPKKRQ